MKDVDGRTYNIPPFTTKSEGAATIVTSMIDPTIQGLFLLPVALIRVANGFL
jgi:hypothetical protein